MKIKTIFLILCTISLKVSAQKAVFEKIPSHKVGMVKVMILYPNEEGKTFDMGYYADKHMPMVAKLFGPSLKHYTIDEGMIGSMPEAPIPFLAIGYFYFEKLSDYEEAFGPNAEKILSDIPNYTNIKPIIQISKVIH